jgi:hypothetical protein
LRSYVSILILLLPLTLLGQKSDSVKQKTDTVRNKFMPTGVRIGTDVISIVKSHYVESFTGWEVNADIDFYRYYLSVDYGSWGRTYFPDGGKYTNDGNYYRIGVDVNFLKKDPERNMFFLGMRYGHSVFSEDYTISITDPLWGSLADQHYTNTNVKAHWLELTTGIKVRMYKFIWMGYTARFKFGLKTGDTEQMLPSDVPGFGRTDREVTWGFNYQIFVRIPLPKKK